MKVRSKAQFEAIEWDGTHSTLIKVLKTFPKSQFQVSTNYLGNVLLTLLDPTRFPTAVGDYLVTTDDDPDKCNVIGYAAFEAQYERIEPVVPIDSIVAAVMDKGMSQSVW